MPTQAGWVQRHQIQSQYRRSFRCNTTGHLLVPFLSGLRRQYVTLCVPHSTFARIRFFFPSGSPQRSCGCPLVQTVSRMSPEPIDKRFRAVVQPYISRLSELELHRTQLREEVTLSANASFRLNCTRIAESQLKASAPCLHLSTTLTIPSPGKSAYRNVAFWLLAVRAERKARRRSSKAWAPQDCAVSLENQHSAR